MSSSHIQMEAFNQVVNDKNTENLNHNDIYSTQSHDQESIDENIAKSTSSISNNSENARDSGAPVKPPRSYTSVVPKSNEDEETTLSTFKTSSTTSVFKNDVKTRIRTIEELLDSSSDLDFPIVETPSPVISNLPTTPPSSPENPSTITPIFKSNVTCDEMSVNKNIFRDNNGASNDDDFSSSSLPNQCVASTSSMLRDSIHYDQIRANSLSPTPTTATSTGNAGTVSVNHYERLIEELKCPGCASPMKAPIKLCSTGHSICQSCTVILASCPLCKSPFIDLRSLTLEALCSKAHFRCSNAAAGCTVRLQIDLLNWHEKQCVWKSMKCFMGRVWGDCTWHGREAQWKDHLESVHADRVFKTNGADLVWDMNGKLQCLAGYYVFEVFGEMFNFYQVYDRDRILFTMTVTSTVRDRKLNFSYEVEMFHKENEALVITQRFPVHSEYDKDILLDGTCVSVALTDLSRFMGQEKILLYRVRINELKSPKPTKISKRTFRKHPIDFQQTNIEGANLKCVPAGVIVTRRPDEPGPGECKDEEMADTSQSEDDSEFEAYIEKNWGTPQMNFNRKYLRNYVFKETSSSSGSSNLSASVADDGRVSNPQRMACEATGTKTKMRNVTSSLRKSFRSLRTDIIDLKKPFSKSPEKKETLIKK